MNTAVSTARFAVRALALAALAVSVMVALLVRLGETQDGAALAMVDLSAEHGCSFVPTQRSIVFGDITVVGSPEYDRAVEAIENHHDAFAHCMNGERMVVYAHVSGGRVVDANALGDNERVGRCLVGVVSLISFLPTTDDMHLMIPLDVR